MSLHVPLVNYGFCVSGGSFPFVFSDGSVENVKISEALHSKGHPLHIMHFLTPRIILSECPGVQLPCPTCRSFREGTQTGSARYVILYYVAKIFIIKCFGGKGKPLKRVCSMHDK